MVVVVVVYYLSIFPSNQRTYPKWNGGSADDRRQPGEIAQDQQLQPASLRESEVCLLDITISITIKQLNEGTNTS